MKKQITQTMLKIFMALMLFSAMFAEAYSQKLPATPKNLFVDRAEINGQYYYTLSWEDGDNNLGQFADVAYFNIYMKYEPKDVRDSNFAFDFQLYDMEKANSSGKYKRELAYLNEGTYTFYVVAAKVVQNVEILSEISEKIAFEHEIKGNFYIYAREYEYKVKVGEQFDVIIKSDYIGENCEFETEAEYETSVKLISQNNLSDNSVKFTFELLEENAQYINFYATNCEGELAYLSVIINGKDFENPRDVIYFEEDFHSFRRFYVKSTDEFAVNTNYQVKVREDYIERGFNCNIEYSIASTTLKDAEIDQTGNVTAPNVAENMGKHYVEVVAVINECELQGEVINTYLSSAFTFFVSDESQMPNATVFGKITDKETNEPIQNAIVIMYSMDFIDTLNERNEDLYLEPYYALTDENGNYTLSVLAGNYFVYCEAENYNPFYNITDGTESGLVVKKNDNLEYNIQLDQMEMPTMVSFSGKVTDQVTGEPIPYALVEYFPSELIDKGILEMDSLNYGDDWRYGNYYTFSAVTDENGNYTIEVSDDHTYIAMASVYSFTANGNKTLYENEFYSETSNFYDALIIDPKANYFAPFNFTLSPYQEKLGVILGNVVDENNSELPSTVLAINLNNRNGGQSVYTAIARNGEFTFDNVPYGKYILLSVPMTVSHIPGYYVSGDFASLNWNEATVIGVDDAQTAVYHKIQHQSLAAVELNGYAEFEGRIGKKGSNIKLGDKTQKVNALSGVTVYLMNQKGDVLDYQITNSEGNFKFKKLPEGEFRIITDKFGYYAGSTDIVIDYKNGVKFSGVMEMEQDLALGVEDNTTITGAKISPMPVTTSAKIEFNSQNGNADIMIIDQAGKLISEFTTNTTEGLNELELQTNDMTNGTYFVIINQNNVSKSIKFVVIK